MKEKKENTIHLNLIFAGYRYDQPRVSDFTAGFGNNVTKEDILLALNAVIEKANKVYGMDLKIANGKEATQTSSFMN